jgi:two-component system NtrC family response regulator
VNPAVLVADDTGRRLAFTEYHGGGFALMVASLAEARAALARQRFDAVLLDDRLPDGFGMDFVPSLKALPGHRDPHHGTGDPPGGRGVRRGADYFTNPSISRTSALPARARRGRRRRT